MERSEELGEHRADVLDAGNGVAKRSRDAEWARLPFKDYLEGRNEMHIHYLFRDSGMNPHHLCAVYKAAKVDQERNVGECGPAIDSLRPDAHIAQDRHGREEQLVFVIDVEIMDEAEYASIPTTGVIDRLQTVDQCKCSLPNPSFNFGMLTSPSVRPLEDGKLDHAGVGDSPPAHMPLRQGPEQKIEGRPDVVDAVPDNQGPANKIWPADDVKAKDEIPSLRVKLFGNMIIFTISTRGFRGPFERLEMFLRPADLSLEADWEFRYDFPSALI